jgi:hypothetical protein
VKKTKHRAVKNGSEIANVPQVRKPIALHLSSVALEEIQALGKEVNRQLRAGQGTRPKPRVRYVKFLLLADINTGYRRFHELVIDRTIEPKSGDIVVIRIKRRRKLRGDEIGSATGIGGCKLVTLLSRSRTAYRLRNVATKRTSTLPLAKAIDIHPLICYRPQPRYTREQMDPSPDNPGCFRPKPGVEPYPGPTIMW